MTTYDQAVGYDAAIPYDGGALAPAVDRNPAQNLRLEVAFATDPNAALPAWVDLSERVHLPSGISITRGRNDEFSTTQTGTMGVALENIDGALTPDNASSPYYPNVLPQRRCRLTYRDPATYGTRNSVPAESASFEGGTVGSWAAVAGAAVANDTAHADVGTKALRITWPTGGVPWAQLFLDGFVIGRRYTVRARVWSATGVPNILVGVYGVANGTAAATKNAFADVTLSWVATSQQQGVLIVPASPTTAGQQTWVDAVMIDETPVGTSLGTFTTTSPADVIRARFDGYIDRWPIQWPDGGQAYSRSVIAATDMLARLGARQKLRSVVVETMALDSPALHFPLSEPADSTMVASIAEGDVTTLAVRQVGSGGTITFAEGTGVPTDGAAAPLFAPASSTSGLILTGRTRWLNFTNTPDNADTTLTVALASTGTSSTAAGLFDNFGNGVKIELDAAGKLVARYVIPYFGVDISTTSAAAYNDGQTHHAAATVSRSGTTVTVRLVVDGVANTSSSLAACPGGIAPFQNLHVGGLPTGSLFTGTLSHVAVFVSNLAVARLLEHRLAQTTGFAGERSDERLARVATWIGLPAERCAFDVGNSTSVGHIDTTGNDPLAYMRKIETTEAGLLFAGTDGRLTFHNRARSYSNAAPALSLPADMLDGGAGMAKDLQLVRNEVTGSRQGGATVRLVDQASGDAYGWLTDDIEVVTTTDEDLAAATAWRLNTSRQPLTRFTDLDLDALTDETYSPMIRSSVDIGARVEITGMPAQAPSSTLRQTVQGYTETITASSWSLSVNATPYAQMIALVLDDPVYGALDTYPLAY